MNNATLIAASTAATNAVDTSCQECLVGLICSGSHDAVIIDAAEARAVRMLARVGLLTGHTEVHQAS